MTYLSSIAQNVGGQLTGDTLGNGVSEAYGYDSNRLQLTSQTATLSSTTLMSLHYYYQASAGQMGYGTTAGDTGQLIAINNSSQINGSSETAAYTYDLQGRLFTSAETTNGSTTNRRFTYDAFGNRLSMYDAVSGGTQIESVTLAQTGGVTNNQLQSVTISGNNFSCSYDQNGNLISDGINTYEYDAENRLQSMNGGAILYAHDYLGHRIRKWSTSLKTEYIWDGDHVIAEYDASSGGHNLDYIYSGSRMIAESPGTQLGGSGSTTFLVQDKQSIRLSLDKFGTVLGQQGTLPFGEETGESGTKEKHHFTAYETDAETGIDFAYHRFYSQVAGRFLSVDPNSQNENPQDPQSWNRYAYVENRAKDSTDPLGLCGEAYDDMYNDLLGSEETSTAEEDLAQFVLDAEEFACASGPRLGSGTSQATWNIVSVAWTDPAGIPKYAYVPGHATLIVTVDLQGENSDGSAPSVSVSAGIATSSGPLGPQFHKEVTPKSYTIGANDSFELQFTFDFTGTLGNGNANNAVSVTGRGQLTDPQHSLAPGGTKDSTAQDTDGVLNLRNQKSP